MQAVILLGGQGTRIRSLHPDCPKALIPVAGKPFLEWQFDWLKQNGITDILLAAGHMGEAIAEWVSRLETEMKITVSIEPKPLGTAGAVRSLSDRIKSEVFLVANGDTLVSPLNIDELVRSHVSTHSSCTMATSFVEKSGRYGTVVSDAAGCVTGFTEKEDRDAGWVNAGVYLLNRSVLALIPAGRKVSIETDTFPRLIADHSLFACPTNSRLFDMGTPDGLAAMELWLKRLNGDETECEASPV
jgi:NDP-sugar pyrophosphorylase family protein